MTKTTKSVSRRKATPSPAAQAAAQQRRKVYAADSYPPEAIPALVQALGLMRQAYALLDQLLEEGKINEGSPAEDAHSRLDDAIGMMEPDAEGLQS